MGDKILVENTRMAVKGKFKDESKIVPKVKMSYPISAEREMKRLNFSYMNIARDVLRKSMPGIMKEYEKRLNELDVSVRHDSKKKKIMVLDTPGNMEKKRLFGEALDVIFLKMSKEVEKKTSDFGYDEKLNLITSMTSAHAIRQWIKTVKDTLGISPDSKHYTDAFFFNQFQKWKAEQINRIKARPSITLMAVMVALKNSFDNNSSVTDAVVEANRNFSMQKRYSGLDAVDAVGNLNSSTSKAIMEESGVDCYQWITKNDDRVRACHKALHGKIIRWDEPPEMWYETKKGIVHTGKYCHPGEDWNCRCIAKPVFNLKSFKLSGWIDG